MIVLVGDIFDFIVTKYIKQIAILTARLYRFG